SLQPEDFATYY
nr:immunoglobulin light chain junction region [Homo sapiens]